MLQVKNNVVRYYEDVDSRKPIKWTFLDSGVEFHVMDFTPGQTMSKSGWKAPTYCFPTQPKAGHEQVAESTSQAQTAAS